MKREELKSLGIADEVIEKVMAMYGKSVETIKGENEQLKVATSTKDKAIEEANKTIDSFKGKKIDEIEKQANEYKTKYEQSKGEYEKTLTETKKRYALELEISKQNVRNPATFKKLLDLEKITLDGDKLVGFEEQVKGFKESEPYLFGEDTKKKAGVISNLPFGSAMSEQDVAILSAAGLDPKKYDKK